jgi:hypothetical protein
LCIINGWINVNLFRVEAHPERLRGCSQVREE